MKKAMTPEFRASFATLFEPKGFQGNDPKYSIVMLFDKTTDISELKNLAKEAVEEKWPDPDKRPANLRHPFRDGDVEKPDMDGYRGKIFVNATSKIRPGVVDQHKVQILDDNPETGFYSGCYARATVVAFAYDKAGNRGVSFGLQNVQKLRDGDTFTGRARAEDEFDAVADTGATASATQTDPNDMFS